MRVINHSNVKFVNTVLLCRNSMVQIHMDVIHQRGQNNDNLFKCEIWTKTFFQKRYSEKHNVTVHGIKDMVLNCCFWSNRFSEEILLNKHKAYFIMKVYQFNVNYVIMVLQKRETFTNVWLKLITRLNYFHKRSLEKHIDSAN